MSTLTNTKIKDTYAGLIKTADNLPVDATPKALEDGVGNALPIEVGTDRINFTDTVDFSGATVTGLPIQPTGLTAGTGTNSMKSADDLTINPANASGNNSIALGDIATAGLEAVSIGIQSDAASRAIAIGRNAQATGSNSIAIGNFSAATNTSSIGIACSSISGQINAATGAIMIVSGSFGGSNNNTASNSIVIGPGSGLRASAADVIAIGKNTIANATGAVALGADITAATENTVTIKKLQMLDYATLDYADDAAAATGGIPLGGVYHTSGALKIRIV